MIQHIYKRLSSATAKSRLTVGALLGVGLLPCPDCGTPMIFHIWPIVGMVLIARAVKERRLKREQAHSGPCQSNGGNDG